MAGGTIKVGLEAFESYANTTLFGISLADDTPLLIADGRTRLVGGGFSWTTKARLQHGIDSKQIENELTIDEWQTAILSI